jgi:hypothetical protein
MGCRIKGRLLPTYFVPFTLCATVSEEHICSFRTDLELLTASHRGWAPLDVVKSTNTTALLRGAIPQGIYTATDASLTSYLQERLVADKEIHLNLIATMQR